MQDNINSGALFKNERKDPGDKKPNATGSSELICPHCKEPTSWFIAAWTNVIKQGKRAGQNMQSLRFEVSREQSTTNQKNSKPADTTDGFDEDIPF